MKKKSSENYFGFSLLFGVLSFIVNALQLKMIITFWLLFNQKPAHKVPSRISKNLPEVSCAISYSNKEWKETFSSCWFTFLYFFLVRIIKLRHQIFYWFRRSWWFNFFIQSANPNIDEIVGLAQVPFWGCYSVLDKK